MENTFSKNLIQWYAIEKRDLPWRKTKNPYFIWLSEVILQQTQIIQGLDYYLKFIKKYPTIFKLSQAQEQEVLKLWQGLGYYSRAKNLHQTAKFIVENLNGKFPLNYKDLLKLKGVGDYTASAIASICYNEPVATVDGNVYRVLSRIFDIDIPINSSKGLKYFKLFATELLYKKDPGTHNQALMDFGATICKPKAPLCDLCIFSTKCKALSLKNIEQRPVKTTKKNIKHRYFHYYIPLYRNFFTLLNQRTQKDIWQGLYEFPLLEFNQSIDDNEVIKFIKELFSLKISIEKSTDEIIHKLSHQHIHTHFWIVRIDEPPPLYSIPITKIKQLPVATLTANFIENNFSKLSFTC